MAAKISEHVWRAGVAAYVFRLASCAATARVRSAKWRRGREQYGPVFIGHPLEELDEELLDAMNYASVPQWQMDVAGFTAD